MKKYKLGEICTIVPGYAFKATDFGKGLNYVIKIKDIMPPYIDILHSEKVETVIDKKYEIKYGDFVMAMTGATIGKIGKLQIDSESKVYINQRVCKFIPEAFCDKEYLYYKLNTQEFQRFIYNNVDSKLAQPNIGHPTIYKYELELPLLSEQRRIGQFLKAIDAKIALNRSINHNLEAMAKQLYDYWFVQFDFPDENGKPYKSSGGKMVWNEKLKMEIPEGWSDGQLSDIANIIMGQSPDGSSYNEVGNGEIFYQGSTDFGIRFPSIRQYTTAPTRFAKKRDILMSVRAPVGATNIANNDCCIGRGLAALNSKVGSITHLYYIIDGLKTAFDQRNAAGTTFGSITKDDLFALPVVVLNTAVLLSFEKVCNAFFEKQMIIGEEIDLLTKQRDSLLPLLMNGQVSLNYDLSTD